MSHRVRTAVTAAALAVGTLAGPAAVAPQVLASADAAPIVDVDGATKERVGDVAFTNPTVEYYANDDTYGKTIRITWTIRNDSNVHVKSMGTAYSAAGQRYNDTAGDEMLMHCDQAVPFRPGATVTCHQYRLVTDAELAMGRTAPDVPKYHVLYGLNEQQGERAWVNAEPVPSVTLPGGGSQTPGDDQGQKPGDDQGQKPGQNPGSAPQGLLDVARSFAEAIFGEKLGGALFDIIVRIVGAIGLGNGTGAGAAVVGR